MPAARSNLPFLAAFVVVGVFYGWTARSDNLSWRWGREQTDYYNLLVDGFLDGRLSLKADVPMELLHSPDPYDPAVRPAGIALHDASLFRGKYYIYQGVVPAVLLLLPFRIVTGTDLPIGAAVLVFVLAGYALSLLLLADIRRRYFPWVGVIIGGFLGVVIGLASCTAILLRRSSMYDLPIASGFAFGMGALFSLHRAIACPTRRVNWLAASSLCWALAIGSRPIYLLAPACLLLVYPLLRRDAAGERLPRARQLRLALAAAGPLAVIGALLAAYNYARFGDVTEFGVRYILSGVYESKIEHFRARYVPWNLHAYFWSHPEWDRYFPFQHDAPIPLPRPRQHFGMDIPFGLLANVPFLWLAATVPAAFAGWGVCGKHLREGRVFFAAVAWVTVSVSAFLFCFYAAMVRYLADFAPALALLAAIGALAIISAGAAAWPRWPRQVATVLIGTAGVASVLVVSIFSIRAYDRMRQFNPRGYQALARVANAPVHWIEQFLADEAGAMTLQVVLPEHAPADRGEELLKTGRGGRYDRILVFYPGEAQVQFAYERAGAPLVRTAQIPLDRSAVHVVHLSLGSLFPPETHPAFAGWPADLKMALLRRLRVEINGRLVLDRYQRFHDATPASVVIGGAGDTENPFSGRVLAITRDGLKNARATATAVASRPRGEERIHPDASGTFRLRIHFPPGTPGRVEPIVVSGETGRGDILSVEYLGVNQFRFRLDHWGRRPYLSESVDYSPGREYALEISHPFYASAGAAHLRAGEGKLIIAIDGALAWECEPLFYPIESEDIFVGINPIGGSEEWFGGRIVAERTSMVVEH